MIHFPVVVRRDLAFLFAAVLITTGSASVASAATYTWNVNGVGSWTTASNWTPARTTPATDDVLVFDGAMTPVPDVTSVGNQTIGRLVLTNNVFLKLQSAGPGFITLTLSGGPGTDLAVPVGCTLRSSLGMPAPPLSIALSPGSTGTLAGRLEWFGQMLPGGAGALTISGTFTGNSGSTRKFGTTVPNGVVFQSGSVYEYSGSDPFGAAAPASVSVFEPGSKFRVATVVSSLPLSGRTISNFEMNLPDFDGTVTISGSGNLVTDDFKTLKGRAILQLPQVRIRGELLTHYRRVEFASGTIVYLDGTTPQLVHGDVHFLPNTELRITNPSGVTLLSDSLTMNGRIRLDGGDLTLPGPGIYPTGGLYVHGGLDLIQGRVHTGIGTLHLTQNATITGGNANSYVNGKLDFSVNPAGTPRSILIPIGDATTYAPVMIELPANTTLGVTDARTTAGDHASIGSSTLNASRSVNRTWRLDGDTGGTPVNATFTFAPPDLDPGVNTNALVAGSYWFSTWASPTIGTRTPTSIQVTGLTSLPDFQIAEPTFTIVASAGAGGSISPTGTVTLPHNGSQSYSITPNPGHVILDVVVDGVSQGPITSYDFTGVTASHTISATFQPFFTISASAGAGGSIAPAGVTTLYGTGNSQAYTITPNAGFVILDVVVDGVSQGAIGTYTFSNVSSNHTIAATFIATYTITASAGAGGTISPDGVTTLVSGASQSYTITPNPGFALLSLVVDGVPISPVTTFVFSSVTTNHTIAATFTPLYVITASAGAGGSIAPSGTTTLPAGSSQSYTITPNAGYVILQVLVDGIAQGPVASYTFSNLAGHHTISATFQQVWTITASSGAGGSVTPSGATVVNAGTSQSYTITPNAGYIILQVLVDGVSQGAINAYTFTNVIANHTISATFQQVFTITATAGLGGTIAPLGVTTKNAGASQSYTITPASGKAVLDVLVDGASVGAVTSYTFTNLSANHTIDATFKTVFTIDATAGVGGTITPSGLATYDAGTTQNFVIATNPGYSVNQVVVDGVPQGPITSHLFANLSAPHTIYASFSAIHAIVANAGSGEFTAIAGFPTPLRSTGIVAGDLNGDGAQDIVVTCSDNSIAVRLGNGAGGFGAQTTYPTDAAPRAPIVADFNRDNRLDVAVVCQASGLVSILYGNGSGGFVQGPKLYGGSQAMEVVAADLNADGRLDLAIPGNYSSWIAIHLATGPATYVLTAQVPAVRWTTAIAAGDMNGDGKIDLVATNPSYGLASVLLNNGSGGFPTRADYAARPGLQNGRLADFNNDGKLDLASVDYGYYGSMHVMLGDGLGGLGPHSSFSVSRGPNDLTIGDLNSDGNQDVVVVNHAAGGWSLSLLFGNGTGGFPVRKDMTANTNNTGAALADFNGDGVLDIATPSSANFHTYLFSGAGGSIAPAGTTAAVPGSNVAYTVTPAAGFSVADVRVDGVSQGPLTSYTFNNVASGHTIAASFTSATAPLIVGGVPNSAEGGATLSLDGNTLVVSDIGASGNDGVSFGAEDAKTGLGVEFADGGLPIDPLVDTGASLDLTLEGGDASALASVETDVTGDGLDIRADFTPIAATEQTVEVWDDGVRVLSMIVPNGETVHRDLDVSSAPQRTGQNRMTAAGDGIEGVQVGLKKKPGGQLLGATQKFTMSRPTTVAGVTVAGNEIRFSALAQQPLVLSGTRLKAKSAGAGSHLAQLRIADQPAFASAPGLEVGGLVATPNGAAQVTALGDDWQITGLGASGNDGASLDLTVAAGAVIEFGAGMGFQIPRDAGAQLVHRVRGTIGSDADTAIATVTETAWDDSITLRSDFGPLGATTQTIQILNGSTVMYSGTHGLDQSVRVVPPLAGPGFRAQAASINTSRSHLKDKVQLAAPGQSDRPTLEWTWAPANGAFDLMIGTTRVAGHTVRFRPNDGAAIKAFTSAELRQKNPGVPELASLVLRPVGIVAGADGSAMRASGGAQALSTNHDKVRLLGPGGALPLGSALTITSAAPSPLVAVRPTLIETGLGLPDSEAVVFRARGRTASASDVPTFPVAAIRTIAGFDIGPAPDSASTATYLMQVFSGGSMVASITSASPIVQAASAPDRVEHRAAGPTFEGRWDTPLTLTVAGGPTVTGDRVRFVRVGAFPPFLSLDALTVEAHGMTAVDFTDVDTAGVTGVVTPRSSGLALALPRNPMRAGDDTKFGVTVPSSQHVRLELFDIAGRRVATLHDGPLAAGTTWVRWEPGHTTQRSSVLFARLRAAGGERIQKFTYLR